MKKSFYFITLRTVERRPYLNKFPGLDKLAERVWSQLMNSLPGLSSREFGTRRDSLFGLIEMGPEVSMDADNVLEQALELYRTEVDRRWDDRVQERNLNFSGPVWQEKTEVRPLETEEELNSIREYILQNHLGGRLHDGWDD